MAGGIYIYAEQYQGIIYSSTAELVYVGKQLARTWAEEQKQGNHANQEGDFTCEAITVFAMGKAQLSEQMQWDGVSTLVIEENSEHIFQEDIRAEILAEILKEKAPSCVILPATPSAKALFSRVAVLLNTGLTADCTELYVEHGTFKQSKPGFGDSVMVVTEETHQPAMVSLLTGIFPEERQGASDSVEVLQKTGGDSGIELLGIVEQNSDSIVRAEKIMSLGLGVVESDSLGLAEKLAAQLHAGIGGTKPMVDKGFLSLEQQIGVTGYVIHPKICLFLGVSGAVQHTEGVRDTKLTIAVNQDPNAAIFSFADYGVIADVKEFMGALYLPEN